MAETIRIEIPVSVNDATDPGLSNITKKMEKLSSTAKKVKKILMPEVKSRGIESSVEKLDKTLSQEHSVEVSADDNATPILLEVEEAAERIGGLTADVEIGADDNLSGILIDAEDSLAAFNGDSAIAEVNASDNATMEIKDVEDSLAALDGEAAVAVLGADDGATPLIHGAEDAVTTFDGTSGTAELGADDNASPIIDDVMDKALSWDGSVWTATVSLVDTATAPLGAIISAVKNPVAQAGTFLGVSAGLADIINTYNDFESTMSQVKAISGAAGKEFEDLTAKAEEMGATTKFTATQSAEAFGYMAMAGWKPQQMMDGISGIMNLAAASGEDLASTSDIVTDAITAFRLKAEDAGHFSDVLAQASSNANTNVAMLGESFKYVAPVAGAMNYTVEDTSLALGLMANASVKGSMAGTALKTSLANLAAPTDSMAKAMDKYGISLTDSEGNMKTLKGVMDNLRSSLGGLEETEQTAAASTIFGKEAMSGMLAIINASEEDYNKLSDAIQNADGAAENMADTMLDNLAGSMTLMQSAVEGAENSLGKRLTPYVREFVDSITDAMPSVTTALNRFMDIVDEKAAHLKTVIGTMAGSEEWQDADLFGKMDIAWDTLIIKPLMEWTGGDGKHLISAGLGTLFSSAAAILPGGEKAGLSAILSSMLIAKGATKLIGNVKSVANTLQPIGSAIKNIGLAAEEAPSIGAFISNLGTMVPTATKFGIAAAAITAAVVGIGVAVDNYNQKRLNNSLEEHFGNVELSGQQVQDVAAGILNQKYLTNVEVALGEIKNADQLRADAEKALESNDMLEFKSSVGIKLTPEEQASYTENIENFVNSKVKELESRSFAAHVSVQTFLGGTLEGNTLATDVQNWARADYLELNGLSEDLSRKVSEALKDGIIEADEEGPINAIQEKMNSITARWKRAEAQAKLDLINQKYGRLSGKALTSETFGSVVEALADQRASANESVDTEALNFYEFLDSAEYAGRITSDENKHYHELAGQAIRNQQATDLMSSLDFEGNTLADTYGDLIKENQGKTRENMQSEIDLLKNSLSNNDRDELLKQLNIYGVDEAQQGGGFQLLQTEDQNALEDRWQVMKSDADEMRSIVDEYVKVGQEVPKQIMDKFQETMAIGAASGDADAAWDVYAKSIADSGDKALIDAISDMATNGELGEEFSAAWKRATAEVTADPVDLDGLRAEVDGDVDIDKDAWTSKLNEALGDLGTATEVNDKQVTITVEKGDCLWKFGEALGVDWQKIAEENNIPDPYIIQPGQELVVSLDDINFEMNEENAQAAIEQAMSALDAEGADFSVTADGVKIDLANVEVDSDTAAAQLEAALGMESGTLAENGIDVQTGATITIPAELVKVDTSGIKEAADQAVDESESTPIEKDTTVNVTMTSNTTNSGDVYSEAEDDLKDTFGSTMETDGSTDVTISQTNNSSEVFDEISSDLQREFETIIPVTAHALITVDYKVANPTANLSFSGGGSGTALVKASFNANGGEVGRNGAELSWVGEEGLEYIIPTVPTRRQRGIELWKSAGRTLGVLGADGQISAHANGGEVGEEVPNTIPYSGSSSTDPDSSESGESEKGNVPTNVVSDKSGVVVQVNLSPQFNISDTDDNNVMQLIKAHIKELADDLGNEIAAMLSEAYENTPVTT